jgi:hypothetical protein
MNENNKPMSRLQRAALISKILSNAEKNPEYKKHVEEKLKQLNQPTYLTEAHKQNSEALIKQIAENKNLEIDWEKEIKQQKINARDPLPNED